MAKFVKGEIVCSSYDSRFIGVFDRLVYDNLGLHVRGDGHVVSCFITRENEFKYREGTFGGFKKSTKEQKDHFKSVLLKYGYSYYKGKVTKEL